LKQVLDVEYNREIYKNITDNFTQNVSYYGGYEFVRDEGSTSHLSVVAANGDTVSITGSINY
jgi:gamma-glutamyltranspeptidase